MTIEKIYPAEYGVYYQSEGKVYHYAQSSHKLLPFSLTNIIEGAAGLHQLGAVTSDGAAYIIFRPSNDQYVQKKVNLIGASKVAAEWQKFIFVANGSAYVVDENEMITYRLNFSGQVDDVAVGNKIVLLSQGRVFEIPWQPNPNQAGTQSAQTISQTMTTEVIFPVPIKSITASRNGFAFALDKDGNPYGWGWNWGFYYDKEVTKPVALKDFWGLTGSISQIVAGDNTWHYITNGDLFGGGHNGQGEVGNGYENPKTISTKAWDGDIGKDRILKPVQIGMGRKFKQIAKGTTLSYHTYEQEVSGQWDSHGRGKAGVLGTGLFTPTTDELKPNIADISQPWRVEIPTQGKEVTEAFFTAANYPPKEVGPVEPPVPVPPIVIPITKEITLQFLPDGTVRWK